jgi:polysaccharide pyruvyl transferase WcaK-like protein
MQINKELKIDWKKILIVGNRSYRNLWDELILLWTIKLLMKQKKEIYVAAYDVERLKWFLSKFIDTNRIIFLTEIPKWLKSGLKYLKEWKFKERKIYREIDNIIIWWGEILTEENPNSYRYRLVSILPCYFSDIKIYLMWWIQIPKKEINKWLFDFLLKKVERIYARDNECTNELKKYWFKNVELFMDTAYFAYDRSLQHWSIKTVKRNYIVVNLNKNAEKFLDEIIEDIKWYSNKGYDVYFVPVSNWINEEYNDIRYLDKIKKKLKAKNINILEREDDFENFLKIAKWAEIVFTWRLHLFMIARFLWVNVKVYPYQKKILKMQEVLKNFNT